MSERGAVAQVYRQFELADAVQLQLGGSDLLLAHVTWAREWLIGLSFTEVVDVERALAAGEGDEARTRRRLPRFDVDCPGRLQLGSRFHAVRLRNISQGGARVDARKGLGAEGAAILTVPDLPPLRGEVRWVDESAIGLRLEEIIPVDVLAHWLDERRRRARSAVSELSS